MVSKSKTVWLSFYQPNPTRSSEKVTPHTLPPHPSTLTLTPHPSLTGGSVLCYTELVHSAGSVFAVGVGTLRKSASLLLSPRGCEASAKLEEELARAVGFRLWFVDPLPRKESSYPGKPAFGYETATYPFRTTPQPNTRHLVSCYDLARLP